MVRLPEYMPADPVPEMALPIMKTMDEGALAHIEDPISKVRSAAMYIHLTLYSEYNFPKVDCNDSWVRRYADPYQPTSSKLWKRLVIFGIAVPGKSH